MDARRGQLVVECSAAALQRGISPRMPLAEANMVNGQQSTLHTFEHRPHEDLAELTRLAISCEPFSPQVGIQQAAQPTSILADISGLANLFGSEYRLVSQATEHCRKLGYLATAAVADSVGQAWALARYGFRTLSLELQPLINPPGDLQVFLELPIHALRLSATTIDLLQQLGVEYIEQLLRLPRKELAARLGSEINEQVDKLLGQQEETIIACRPPAEFYREKLFDYPTGKRTSLEAVFERLVSELCKEMRSQQRGSLQWQFGLIDEQRHVTEVLVGLFSPTTATSEVMSLLKMRLDQQKLPSLVHEVFVAVTHSVITEEKQRELFARETRQDRQALNHLVNRLSSRLGNQNLVTPRMTFAKLPEDAFYWKPLVGRLGVGRQSGKRRAKSSGDPLDRPLQLFPQPINLTCIVARHNHSPAQFQYQGRTHRVRQVWGPERIETRWWQNDARRSRSRQVSERQGRTVRRDYYRIELESGDQWWIFRDLRREKVLASEATSSEWFLHGTFD